MHTKQMPNPTPQQRIDALVREFDEMLKIFNIEDREPNEDEVKLESASKQFIRHACAQAYLAGLEDVEAECLGLYRRDELDVSGIEFAISQLKEQINQ